MSYNVIHASPSEAWNRDLPPIGFSVDSSGTAMAVSKFPEPNYYLRMARPPRGVLEFVVKAYRNVKHDHNILKRLIHDFCEESRTVCDMSRTTTTEIDGVSRRSREFLTGRNLSRKKWLAAIIPSPDGGPYGLLVLFGAYVGPHRNGKKVAIMKRPVLKGLKESFQLTNSR
ncbi:MAG: hypothetical protein AM324_006085 [Candidatus Thorarchaeota archaeon SMTZ1-83]|nr:MAG: hypothetical protein AM324_07220 [Candidatus Thorarchaeota archaeon SMTZ1-83]